MALTAFFINALLTPVILAVAHRFEWYDHHNERKIHREATPRLGGVGIVIALTIAAIGGVALIGPSELTGGANLVTLVVVGVAMAAVFGLGVYDDFVNLRAPVKFGVQLVAALAVALSGATLGRLDLPWAGAVTLHPAISIPLTVFWIVASVNAVNLIDGADGLAGGVGLLAALFMGLVATAQGGVVAATVAFSLVGALAGFLLYNLPKARIFMGDGGSTTLGFLLAVIPLLGLAPSGPTAPHSVALFPVVTLLFIPAIDTLLAIVRRVARGLPVHSADREHIHHRLIDRGIFGRRLLAIVYAVMIALGFIAMLWYSDVPRGVSGAAMAASWIVLTVVIIALGRSTPTQPGER